MCCKEITGTMGQRFCKPLKLRLTPWFSHPLIMNNIMSKMLRDRLTSPWI